ncbi:hypothetical protein CEE36_03470 [candidate division TA06 bacterium B3_TA06]|uniref:Uncharacterized protein n=1 Tax=candidate division TA06 bacterium B3_TA06 TaxID=2012487 RepID=A0A532V988_UNCT6|nr:MAG: hypothetical protein CEE36_03470 [candidate division TA06 bacterium B3_TA06]
MNFEIYHQLGHNAVWNFESLEEDGTGEGFIISPRHIPQSKVESLDHHEKARAIFDPQFFLPRVPLGKLSTYDFFPHQVVESVFDTSDYEGEPAERSADSCVDFQRMNNFRYIVIPTRYMSGMPTDFQEQQTALFVGPFLDAVEGHGVSEEKEILLQLVLNSDMVKDEQYSADILNWVTGIPRIKGVYLIVECIPRSKQIKDIDFLYSLLKFVDKLSQHPNKLEVILGYLNTESLVLSLASPSIITIGSYENTRMFNIANFSLPEPRPRGPTPRLYVTKLLQLIDYNYIGAIRRVLGDSSDIFDENRYQAIMFDPDYRWWFTKPEPYKHYFLEFSRQLRTIRSVRERKRYELVSSMMRSAIGLYSELRDSGIIFDSESDGSHIAAWLTAANLFAKDKNWVK